LSEKETERERDRNVKVGARQGPKVQHSRALMVALLLGTAGVAAAAAASASFCFEMASSEEAERSGGWP